MKIEIDNNELKDYTIDRFDISFDLNKHTELSLILRMDKKNFDLDNKSIKVDNIFYGNIYEYKMAEYGYEGFYIEIMAYSLTKELDRNLKTRIYQDKEFTYMNIINQVMDEYNIKYICSEKLKKKINKVYFQDNITDYEFLKRILADINEAIFVSYNGLVVFGIDTYGYSEISEYKEKRITNKGVEYLVENKVILQADSIDNLFVLKSHIYMHNQILNSDILLSKKNIEIEKIRSNVKGRFIEAKVVDLIDENEVAKMKVSFLIDGFSDKSINKKSICFSTPYSKIHTGMYITPEIGDKVDVYFPSDNEDDMKVAFCINNDKSSIFLNKEYKNFLTNDFSMILDKKDFKLILNDLNININNNLNLEVKEFTNIKSNNKLNLKSDKDIQINTIKDLVINATKIHNN
ncbi:hypothetical protein [Oceanivirga miroungae]|uniref:Gp5/Type VI secretion system Vgr protein OB-fold domain-containing protein n=1 Tax=Oceanivirga miroungae TaxID=1130046 RepID=A0A6I8M939_9FUSO|nr:hypothetical protein [Oceanivirga miroungae]VWL85325.1 hypothetical protein OMES3154_00609 [Oceanivirga miroungae]